MREVLARAALLAASAVVPPAAWAQAGAAYDFEAAGGALVALPVAEQTVDGVAAYCTGKLPSTAQDWRQATDGWDERHAPWRVATESVRTETYAMFRAQGEDPALVQAALAPIIRHHVDTTLAEMAELVDRDGVDAICAGALQMVTTGQFDVEAGSYESAINLLRAHLPKTFP